MTDLDIRLKLHFIFHISTIALNIFLNCLLWRCTGKRPVKWFHHADVHTDLNETLITTWNGTGSDNNKSHHRYTELNKANHIELSDEYNNLDVYDGLAKLGLMLDL